MSRERREKIAMKIAWMLPRDVAMWCFYRVLAHATQGQWSDTPVVGMTWETAANRWIGSEPGSSDAE